MLFIVVFVVVVIFQWIISDFFAEFYLNDNFLFNLIVVRRPDRIYTRVSSKIFYENLQNKNYPKQKCLFRAWFSAAKNSRFFNFYLNSSLTILELFSRNPTDIGNSRRKRCRMTDERPLKVQTRNRLCWTNCNSKHTSEYLDITSRFFKLL